MNRFNGSAPVVMDHEMANWVTDLEGRDDCCHCQLATVKLWYSVAGKRIAHACCIEHLAEVYPQYTTDTTGWDA